MCIVRHQSGDAVHFAHKAGWFTPDPAIVGDELFAECWLKDAGRQQHGRGAVRTAVPTGRREAGDLVHKPGRLIPPSHRHDMHRWIDQIPTLCLNGVIEGRNAGVVIEQKAPSRNAILALTTALVLADDDDKGAGVVVVESSALRLDDGDSADHGRACRH